MNAKRCSVIVVCLLLIVLGLTSYFAEPASARPPWEGDSVKPYKFVVEPPTLISMGFEWYIEGDNNHNATVDVSYRKEGDHTWKHALPLLRIQNEESIRLTTDNVWDTPPYGSANNRIDYITPNLFAGSIFDLEPDTEYQCRFTMRDPDGVLGGRREIRELVTVRTRPEPTPYAGGKVYHVYPREYTGTRLEPAFVSLPAAYFIGWNVADWGNLAPPRVQPGDTIIMHAGLYQEDWTQYGSDLYGKGQGANFFGTYFLTQSGTSDKPITIKGAGDGEVILDGNGNFNLFNVMKADYHHFEGITFRNTDIAIWAGRKHITGARGLTVKRCRFEDVGDGIYTDWAGSKNFYIADNVFIGRHDPDTLHTWGSPLRPPAYPLEPCWSEFAVKVAGAGHVICHNYVANFHDGIDFATYGVPEGYPPYEHPDEYPVEEVLRQDKMFVSNDVYNNYITNVHDDFIEADGNMYNIRILRNIGINSARGGLSSQTLYGGPVYFVRNILYHVPRALKQASYPSGMLYFHNTFMAQTTAGAASNYHFRNNLMLGWLPGETIFSVTTFTNYTSSDYNGFRPDPAASTSFQWTSPVFGTLVDYVNPLVTRKFNTLSEYSLATGHDVHSIIVDYDIFMNVSPADPIDITKLYNAGDMDFRLNSGAVAIDAGVVLPSVNDDFVGTAPDLGALEFGKPLPIYGPRP